MLNRSQYSKDGQLKSCPNCSTANGEEHVYYSYPEYFGTTPKRASSNRPDGPQSHCESCRFEKGSYPNPVLCSEIEK
ncbi:hypothetical protein AAT22_15150 [Clostridium sp. C8]|nr:hypothetical protein AAT22_15150 [Clostridium sp. C8]